MNKIPDWEIEFDELVEAYGWEGDLAEDGKDKFIKSFISDLLKEAKAEDKKENGGRE